MTFATTNPTTGKVEATFDGHGAVDVEARLALAATAFDHLRGAPMAERAACMTAAAELLEGEVPDVARMLTTEMGKPFAAAKGEVAKCAMTLRWFAQHAEALLADEVAADGRYVHYQPLGPVLAIMPWNYPLWQTLRFAGPALMAGNVGVLKHAPNVPQTALYLEGLFRRSGWPEGSLVNLFVEVDEVAGIIADPRIAAVTLTGSERAGMAVAEAAGRSLKKCVLELGGSDPFVVLASADLARAVSVGVEARTQNNGQSCIAAKRFIVEASVFEEFTERFTEQMAGLVVGDPLDTATDVGPLVTERQRRQLADQVDDARAKGATVRCGGAVPDGPGWFYPPTVLTEVSGDMAVCTQEVFGPVATVQPAADLDEAIAMANATRYGLGSSVWTTDPDERHRCVEEIEAGQVFVNAMVASTPELPFGGVERSGFGRELAALGIKEFCNPKTVWVA